MDKILFSTPDNPLPEDHKAGYFEGCDGRQLRYALFRSTGQNARGTIVLLHGRNECIEKYYETIRDLTKAGFWVATFDWRGQGGSERIKYRRQVGYVRNFRDYEHDLAIFLEYVVLPDARMPYYLLAHSMGGLVALSMAPNIANRIDRIAVVSPFIGLKISGFKRALLNAWLTLFNFTGLGSVAVPRPSGNKEQQRFESLSSDQDRYIRNWQIFEEYPEFRTGPPTVRWLYLMLKAMGRVTNQTYLEQITTPTIILGGSNDGIVPFEEFEDISTKFRAGQLIPLYGSRHEILQEVDIFREPALAAILAFFTSDEKRASEKG